METGALAAENEANILAEVEVGVVRGATLVEAYDPDVVFLHGFEGAGNVDHLGNANVLAGSGGRFGGDRTDGSRPAFGKNDAVDAGSVGRAEEGAEVVGIFYAVEGEEEFGTGRAGWGVQEIL